jgi:hypothetical protein
MNSDSLYSGDYVEYLIIGVHSTISLVLLWSTLFRISVNQFAQVSPLLFLVLVPIAYVIGILVDSVAQIVLASPRTTIKSWVFGSNGGCKDEIIAVRSPTLYTAYEWRMRRARVPGAAIFNWPLLGAAFLSRTDTNGSLNAHLIVVATLMLTVISLLTWVHLMRRAYVFRKNACEAVQAAVVNGASDISSDTSKGK